MRNFILYISTVLTIHLSQAQNLVPNPSFEEYISLAPTNVGSTYFSPPWFTSPLTPVFGGFETGTPDYYNTQMDFSTTLIPDYEMQNPRTGSAIMGLINAFDPADFATTTLVMDLIESIQVRLNEPMQVGAYYDVSFYVAKSKNAFFSYYDFLGTDELGAYFHTDTIYTHTWLDALSENVDSDENVIRLLEEVYDEDDWVYYNHFVEFLVDPDIKLNQLLIDTEEWVRVDTLFYADKPYEFMYFGMFNWYDEINAFYPATPYFNHSYVMIDDVSVSLHGTVKETAQTGNDTTLCIGESMVLMSHDIENYIYHWSDSHGNEWDIANPTVTPDTTTTYYLSVKDYTFTETFDTLHIEVVDCDSIGVQEFEGFSVELYPNPASTQIHIESPYAINSWKLIDAVGQEVASSKYLVLSANLNIDVSAFKAGLYFLELEINDHLVIKQLMID